MTNKKIARTPKGRKRPTKSRKEQPLPAGLIERAAERAGLKSRKTPAPARVAHDDLQRWNMLLERAQHEVLGAAPRHLPMVGDGEASAIKAYDTLRWVRIEIARTLQAAGGAA
jgi:hypothetical protein